MFVGARSLKSLLQIVDNGYQLHQYSCFIFDKDQIMQLKPLFTLLPVVLSSVVQAQENNEQAVDETVTVHGQSIPTDQRTRSDLDKVRGIANADIFSGITSVQSNNMHNEAGHWILASVVCRARGVCRSLLMGVCNPLIPLVAIKG
ncbi:hypothetical protein ACN26L_002105 [Vibrio cholerae]